MIHRKNSDCERAEDIDRAVLTRWGELKYESILPVDYVRSENSEPDVIISTQDRSGNLAKIARSLFKMNFNIKSGQINGKGCYNNGIFIDIELMKEAGLERIEQRFQELCQQWSQILDLQSPIEYVTQFREAQGSRRLHFKSSEVNQSCFPSENCRTFRVVSKDRRGLTAEIAELLSRKFNANVIGGHMVTNKQYATFEWKLYLEYMSESIVDDMQDFLLAVPSVFNVYLEIS
jgi:formyltetrahydrofolate hydrolase